MAIKTYDSAKIVSDVTTGGEAEVTLNEVGVDTERAIKYVEYADFDAVNYADTDTTVIIKMTDGTTQEWSWDTSYAGGWGRTENVLPNTFLARQGCELEPNWNVVGTPEVYALSGLNTTKIQVGVAKPITTTHTVTFPVAYSYAPLVFLQTVSIAGVSPITYVATITETTATTVTFITDTADSDLVVNWMAIGPNNTYGI